MKRRWDLVLLAAMRRLLPGAVVATALLHPAAALTQGVLPPDREAAKRGEYLFRAGGCAGCHTDVKNKGAVGAGGRELKTPFGTFYGPNITPDPDHGIGRWSDDDFVRALRQGVDPHGRQYFPVFPFPSFTKIIDADLRDLKAYLFSLPPSPTPSKPHEIRFPFNLRVLQFFWKKLFFEPGPFKPDTTRSAELNRGAYLVEALGHCGECHTPRNIFGASDRSRALIGTKDGPEGAKVPNITPDLETGIGKWSAADLEDLLRIGVTVDGDFVGSLMAEVVRETTSKLSESDLKAMVAYLRSLKPVQNAVRGR